MRSAVSAEIGFKVSGGKVTTVALKDASGKAVSGALREDVLSVTADSPSDIRLMLSGSREARWGSSADTVRKAAVLDVLMTRKGTVFDVSSPELPTVS